MGKKKWLSVLLAAAVALAVVPATVSADGQATISIGQDTYGTLQEALAAAEPGETIELGEGTVSASANEQFRVSTENLTIKGAGADKTVIDTGAFSVSGQAGVLVEASGVTIQDLRITSTTDNGGISTLKFSAIGTEDELPLLESGTVENVTLSSKAGHALNIHGVEAMTVDGLTVEGVGKCGISIASAKNVTVSNSVFGDEGWNDIQLMFDTKNPDNAAYMVPSCLTLGEGNDFGESTAIASERPSTAEGGADTITAPADSGLVVTLLPTGEWAVTAEDPENPSVAENTTTGFRYRSLAEALQAVKNGETIQLLADAKLDKMLDIRGLENVTLDLGGKTVTASEDFAGEPENNKHLAQVVNSKGIKIANGTLKATAANKNTLHVYGSTGVVLENMTLDHEAAFKGAPLVANGSTVSVGGAFKLVTGENSWYGINLDSKNGETSLTFVEKATLEFVDNSGEDLALIYVENTDEAAGFEPPTVVDNSDEIRLDQGEDGSYDVHTHTAAAERQGVKDATCTEEGYTGDVVCSVCGEVIEKGEAVPKIAHSFKDGKCTVCGAADPDYEPATPTSSTQSTSTTGTTETTEENTGIPGTGVSSHTALLVLLLLTSGGVAVLAASRKKTSAK